MNGDSGNDSVAGDKRQDDVRGEGGSDDLYTGTNAGGPGVNWDVLYPGNDTDTDTLFFCPNTNFASVGYDPGEDRTFEVSGSANLEEFC